MVALPQREQRIERTPSLLEELFHQHGPAYLESHVLPPHVAKVLRAIIACRTSALGGHLYACEACGCSVSLYNSCQDRHCPICQHARQVKWVARRMERMLSVKHFHVVFTLPAELRPLMLANQEALLPLLFRAASSTLMTLGRQRLGGDLGISIVLHTWGGNLQYHPHVHCIVTGGAFSSNEGWNEASSRYLFPVAVMRQMYRGAFLEELQRAFSRDELTFVGECSELEDPKAWPRLRDTLYRKDWVVYAKRPFAGPAALVKYLGAYTQRVAISNSRVVSLADTQVTIRDKKRRHVRLRPEEFIRRFLLHILPKGFTKIRHYGLYAPTNVKRKLPAARASLGLEEPVGKAPEEETSGAAVSCPRCKGHLRQIRAIAPDACRLASKASRDPPLSPLPDGVR